MILSQLTSKSKSIVTLGGRYYSSTTASSLTDEVLFETKNKCLNITLNRPKALNALNTNMVSLLTPKYKQLHRLKDGDQVVVMKGAGDKAFCAGGDIRAIYDGCKPGVERTTEVGDSFFRDEYILNHLIHTSPVPQVSIYNGFTMGGGVGLSVHGRYRVATESTVFAMPETGIGFFCDVGGSYFLPRLPYSMGMYLGLTGAKLKAKDCFTTGVTTQYIPLNRIAELQGKLESLSNPTAANVQDLLNSYHEKFEVGAESIANKFTVIDRIFSKDSVERILEELKAEGSDWSKQTLATLDTMSPTALKVVHRQLVNGSKLNFAECLQMEFRMSQVFIENNDFFEGVRALLVDKDKNPKWKPSKVSEVTDSMVMKYFKHLGERELKF